jgi:DNA helicase-2/ATP-dependent DNA helicase PcrA
MEDHTLAELFDELMERSGYLRSLKTQGEEGLTRMENVAEFKSNLIKYGEESPENGLSGFLEEVTLYTDIDGYDENADNVVMMTMHSAKGLEFPYVFFCGAEEGIFPGMQAIYNPEQIEEERRLAYVCITRAKQRLYITNAGQRMIFGQTVRNRPSRFAKEIPENLCKIEDTTIQQKKVVDPSQTGPALARARNRANNDIGIGGVTTAAKTPMKAAAPAAVCDLKPGDRVKHGTFGEGMIAKVTPMGGDNLLEVIFDTVGTKKIMFKFAKLTKL